MYHQRIVLESSGELRSRGFESLRGNWFKATLVTLLFSVLTLTVVRLLDEIFGTTVDLETAQELYGGLSALLEEKSTPLSGLYLLLVYGTFSFGVALYFIKMVRKRNPLISDLFAGFADFGKTLGLFLWMALWTFLWFCIPFAGIVFAVIARIRYSQAFFLMIDNPELSIRDCVNESKRIMEGNKGRYFTYRLSFIGWYLLAWLIPITLGFFFGFLGYTNVYFSILFAVISNIGIYMVDAYVMSTNVRFYQILTEREEEMLLSFENQEQRYE